MCDSHKHTLAATEGITLRPGAIMIDNTTIQGNEQLTGETKSRIGRILLGIGNRLIGR